MAIKKEDIEFIITKINDRYANCDNTITRNKNEIKFLNRIDDITEISELQGENSVLMREKEFLFLISNGLKDIVKKDTQE